MKRTMVALAAACFCSPLFAEPPPVSLKGHDPVSYFTEGRPVKGLSNISYDFDEARYHFASAKNRERFASSPDRYMPQYSGLCAAGLAHGVKAVADPTVWKIVDGKLYVFFSAQAREEFEKDPSMLAKSQQNWRSLE